MATQTTCGEALMALLERYGVDTVFGIPGAHTLDMYRGIASSNIRHVLARHEQAAASAAGRPRTTSVEPTWCWRSAPSWLKQTASWNGCRWPGS